MEHSFNWYLSPKLFPSIPLTARPASIHQYLAELSGTYHNSLFYNSFIYYLNAGVPILERPIVSPLAVVDDTKTPGCNAVISNTSPAPTFNINTV